METDCLAGGSRMAVKFFDLQGATQATTTATGEVCLLHGTLIDRAESIYVNGVDFNAIQNISGRDDFHATISPINALSYCETWSDDPKKWAILKFAVQPKVIEEMLHAEIAKWSVEDSAVRFLKESHQTLNAAMTNVEIITKFDM